MPARYIQLNYGDARRRWGAAVTDRIWRGFNRTSTQARATRREDDLLKKARDGNGVRHIIMNIQDRSFNGFD
ncbi:MAG: hypothetical protein OXD31_16245 [Chloroflexi bacterium]|nr:hypothetical protein [Chloroflexota bacterium]